MKLLCAYKSDTGKVRSSNEDSIFVDTDHKLFMIADGMGGLARGKETSEMAIKFSRKNILGKFADLEPEERLRRAIQITNSSIYSFAGKDRQKQKVGTTLTILLFQREDYYLGHIGDTRCYLLRESEMQLLTEDQTLVGELIKKGKISVEEADIHPEKHILTEALGLNATTNVLTYIGKIRKGDVFILCSDGLYDYVYDCEISDEIKIAKNNLPQAIEELFFIVNSRGAEDNISLICVEILQV